MFIETTSANPALANWLTGVAQYGTFIKNAAATWTNIDANVPPFWTVQSE